MRLNEVRRTIYASRLFYVSWKENGSPKVNSLNLVGKFTEFGE